MSIFDKIKGMSYIAESAVLNDDMITVRVDPAELPEFKKKMAQLNVNGLFTMDKLKSASNAAPNAEDASTIVLALDGKSNRSAIQKTLDDTVTAGKAKMLTPEMAYRVMLNRYYINDLTKKRNDFEKTLEGRMSVYEAADMLKELKVVKEREMAFVATSLNAMRKDPAHAGLWRSYQQLTTPFTNMEQEADKIQRSEITKLMSEMTDIPDNKEEAIGLIAPIWFQVEGLKKRGAISGSQRVMFENKMDTVARKFNIKPEEFKQLLAAARDENMAKAIGRVMYGKYNSVEQYQQEYGMLISAIEDQKATMNPKEVETLKQGIEETAKTRITAMKLEKEHPEMFVKPGEKAAPIPGAATVTNTSEQTGTVYTIDPAVRLQLGQTVKIEGMSKYIDKNKKINGKDMSVDAVMRSAFAKIEPTVFNLFGYEPKGDAAGAIASLGPTREFMGSMVEWAAKDSLGLLGSILRWKGGRDFGEGVGKFLRHEMVDNPLELNPELAKFELFVRKKYDPQKLTGLKRTADTEYYKQHRATTNYDKAIMSEDLGAPAGPAVEGTSPGTDMNVPGSIPGAGPIAAPTKDKDGSGDFPGKKKKKIIKEVLTFDEFWELNRDK